MPAEAVPGVIAECAEQAGAGRRGHRQHGLLRGRSGGGAPPSASSSSWPAATACASSARPAWASINTDPTAPMHASRSPRSACRPAASASRSSPARSARRCSSWPTASASGSARFVSLGNKGDVSANDLLNYWDDDPATEVVLPVHRELRQPPQVRPRRPAGVAAQADRGGEVRPRLARRRRRRRPVPAGRRDPRRHRPRAVRRRPGARRPATAGRATGGRADQRRRARPCWRSTRCGPAASRSPSCRSDTRAELAPPAAGRRDRRQPASTSPTARSRPTTGSRCRRVLADPGVDARAGDLHTAARQRPPTTWPARSPRSPKGAGKPVLAVTLGLDDGPLGPGSRRAGLRLPGARRWWPSGGSPATPRGGPARWATCPT